MKTMQDWKNLRNELTLMQKLDHPHIVQVYEQLEDSRYYCFVTEFSRRGNLLEIITSENGNDLTVREIARIIK